MKANELQINTFLQAPNVQFVIPVYQRNYDWTNKECKELFNDILGVEKENRGTHFIGSIVFIHEGTYSTSEVKELVIIDGQQRLTTVNILYVSLYRFAKENGLPQDADRILNMFLTNQYVQSESNKLKLKQTDVNSAAFHAIMHGTERDFDRFSNVIENYNYFRTLINQDNFQTILGGINRLIFVEISLERDKDDPQRIFESLNSTGLDLSQSDLIRNFILMDLEPREQQLIFEQIWNPIEENARDITLQKSVVSDYIRDYLTLRNKKIPNKSRVYEEFKKLYPIKNEEYQQELENIKSLSSHYRKFINPSVVADQELKKQLEYIARLEVNVAYPFLLQVFEDEENGKIDRAGLISILKLIQSYSWRRFIVGLPTNALNKIFMTLYSEVDTEDYYNSVAIALLKKKGSGKFPNDEEVRVALHDRDMYNIKSKNRNYFFELLENYNNREFVDTSRDSITIEHIFPQNPNEEWLNTLSPEELFDFKEHKLNTIANLTLSGNNGALSNKSFHAKKVMNIDGGEQGYLYSRLWLNVFLKDLEEWNIENYERRFELITERFFNIWEFPDVEIPVNEEFSEQSIFQADDPTHKKLEYFIFEDTKIEEETVAKMYFYVIEKMYAKNPQLLHDNQEILKFSREASEFRTPQEVVNGYYIEANIDSASKFRVLKKLLELYEMEEDLLIKYAESESNEPTRFGIRRKYWKQLLPQLLEHTDKFRDISPSKSSWISATVGLGGVSYTCESTRECARVSIVIATSSKERNKLIYKILKNNKEEIERKFGRALNWYEMPEHKMSYVKFEKEGLSMYDDTTWPAMTEFFLEYMPRLVNAFEEDFRMIELN